MGDIVTLTPALLWEIIKHTVKWLINLKRAGNTRKKESSAAVKQVIMASRETAVYMRQITKSGNNYETEKQLSLLWTDLGFKLKDIGLIKLAELCDLKGVYWSDPDKFDKKFLEKTDLSLEKIEETAKDILGKNSKQ